MEQTATNTELRILILEDLPADAELMERALKKAGICFVSKRVERQDAFAAALDEFHPDIVLSDYKLPGFTGLAALKLVAQLHPEIPAVIVTGALSDIEAVELIRTGAKDYVLKDRLARLAPAVQGVLAMERGVRAREAAEKALQESETKFRGLATQTALGLAIIDGTRFAYVNPRFAEIFGYSEAEILKLAPLDLIVEDDRLFMEESINRCIRREAAQACRAFRGVRKDGAFVDIECYGTSMETGGKPMALASILDVTERNAAQNALRDSEERFHAIVNAMPQGILMQLAGGKICAANASAERILGVRGERIVGFTPAALPWHAVHEDGTPFPAGDQPAAVSLRTGESCHGIVMGIKRGDDRLIWISANSEPLFHAGQDNPYAAVTTFAEIEGAGTAAARTGNRGAANMGDRAAS